MTTCLKSQNNFQSCSTGALFTLNLNAPSIRNGAWLMSTLIQGVENTSGAVSTAIDDIEESGVSLRNCESALVSIHEARDLVGHMIKSNQIGDIDGQHTAIKLLTAAGELIDEMIESSAKSTERVRRVVLGLSCARDQIEQMAELSAFIELNFDQVAIDRTAAQACAHRLSEEGLRASGH
jgi:hypothetical protein